MKQWFISWLIVISSLVMIVPAMAQTDGVSQSLNSSRTNKWIGDQIFKSGNPWIDVKAYGAVGDGNSDDTLAFQNAWNAACGSGGGRIFVPPTANSYVVNKINGTNCNNVIISGNGDQSVIKINNEGINGNWWDLSGSNNIEFSHLKFIDNGSPVRIAFLWACTGTSCATSGVLAGLNFDHVNVNAKFVLAGLYGYGYGPLAGSFTGGGGLSITNSTWQNTNNSATLVGEETRTAVLDLTAYNAGSVRSDYVTLTTSTAIASQTYITNSIINDAATTGSTKSNNAAIVADGINQFTMSGGQVGCLCVSDVIGWTSVEGMTFIQTAFQEPTGGSACITTDWVELGGGVNAAIGFHNVLFSCPGPSGAIIALDQGTGAATGGVWFLTFEGADVGLNTNNDPFIGKTAAGCGSFTATNNWILQSNLNLVAGANNIVTCGSIDGGTTIQNAGTVTIPATSVDISTHLPGKLVTSQAFTSSSGTYTTPANTKWIEVLLQGPGGGGAGSGTTTTGGAGGTGTATCWNTSGAACTSPVYSAGAGGGAAGASSTAGGAAGVVGGSSACTTGFNGALGGTAPGSSAISGSGGSGASSSFAGGGVAGIAGGGGGGTGTVNSGAGGGGAGGVGTVNPGGGGGAGASCYVIINNPALTYTYAVGPAGGVGAAGTSGAAGGAGAAGYIRVIEH